MSSIFIEWHFLYTTYNDYTVIIKLSWKKKLHFFHIRCIFHIAIILSPWNHAVAFDPHQILCNNSPSRFKIVACPYQTHSIVIPQFLGLLDLGSGSFLTTGVPRTMITQSWHGLLELGSGISSIPGKSLHRHDLSSGITYLYFLHTRSNNCIATILSSGIR